MGEVCRSAGASSLCTQVLPDPPLSWGLNVEESRNLSTQILCCQMRSLWLCCPFCVGGSIDAAPAAGAARGSCRVGPTWAGRPEARIGESGGHGRSVDRVYRARRRWPPTPFSCRGRRRRRRRRRAWFDRRGPAVRAGDRIARPGWGTGVRERDVRAACPVTCDPGFTVLTSQAVGFSRPTYSVGPLTLLLGWPSRCFPFCWVLKRSRPRLSLYCFFIYFFFGNLALIQSHNLITITMK
jgi:hypothetical protein